MNIDFAIHKPSFVLTAIILGTTLGCGSTADPASESPSAAVLDSESNDAPAPAPDRSAGITGTDDSAGGPAEVSDRAPSAVVPVMTAEAFQDAALNGEADAVQRGLRQGIDVNSLGPQGRTALQLAAFNGHTKAVRVLLDADADLSHRDGAGRTALMYAATGDNAETVGVLLAAGANPNLADRAEQFTALMFAASEGHLDVVKMLVEAGADASPRDVDGDTAAQFAKQNDHDAVAKYLESLPPQ